MNNFNKFFIEMDKLDKKFKFDEATLNYACDDGSATPGIICTYCNCDCDCDCDCD